MDAQGQQREEDEPTARGLAASASSRLWRWLGLILLAIGSVGIVVPLLPTTIFWILAAFCFGRGDPRLRAWIFSHPTFGGTVEGFVTRGVLSRRGKLFAISGMGGGCLVSALVVPWVEARVALGVVFVLVAGWLATRPEL